MPWTPPPKPTTNWTPPAETAATWTAVIKFSGLTLEQMIEPLSFYTGLLSEFDITAWTGINKP